MGGKLKGPKDIEDKTCTDCCCLCLFITFWIGIAGIAAVVISSGSIANIVYGTDYMGNRCGTGEFSGKTKLWYPRIAQDVYEQSSALSGNPLEVYLYGLCVASCPVPQARRTTSITDYGYGHTSDAKERSWSVDMATSSMLNRCVPRSSTTESNLILCAKPSCGTVHKPCVPGSGSGSFVPEGAWLIASEEDAPLCHAQVSLARSATVEQPGAGPVLTYVFKISNTVEDVYEAIKDNWMKILTFGIALSTAVNFGWMVVLFFFAGCAVQIALFLLQAILFLLSAFCFIKAGYGTTLVEAAIAETSHLAEEASTALQESTDTFDLNIEDQLASTRDLLKVDETYAQYYLYAAWVLLLSFVLLEILLCIAKKHIAITVALVSEATQAMRNSKALVFLPVFISAVQLLVLSFVVVVLMYISVLGAGESYEEQMADLATGYSSGVQALDTWVTSLGAPPGLVAKAGDVLDLSSLSKTDEQLIMAGYVSFGLVWTYFTLSAIGLICISANVFYFYFVDKDTVTPSAYDSQYDDNQTDWPVIVHLGYTLRFHVGTAAFGAFILAAVTVVQVATKSLFDSMKKVQGDGTTIQIVEKCVQCALWCFKKSIEFVNSYAYAYVFLDNSNFCTACKSTFTLMTTYPTQIAINKIVQAMLTLLQSCLTPLICTFVAYSSSNFLPAGAAPSNSLGELVVSATVFILSYLMTKAFAQVYEQVVQSLTVCVLHDIQEYEGRYTGPQLRTAFEIDPPSDAPPTSSNTDLL